MIISSTVLFNAMGAVIVNTCFLHTSLAADVDFTS